MSPSEGILDHVLQRALQHGEPAEVRALDRLMMGGSQVHWQPLVNDGYLIHIGPAVLPTFKAIRSDPQSRFGDKSQLLDLAIGVVCGAYDRGAETITIGEVIDALESQGAVFLREDEQTQFFLKCALSGLQPAISPTGNAPHDSFCLHPELLRMKDLASILKAQADNEEEQARARQKRAAYDKEMLAAEIGRLQGPSPLETALERLLSAAAIDGKRADIARRDANEIGRCLDAEASKATVLLCGSLLESVLIAILDKNAIYPDTALKAITRNQKKKWPADASLSDLVDMACSKELRTGLRPLLTAVHERVANLVNQHRNLIHPDAEVRAEGLPATLATAGFAQASVVVILESLLMTIEGGWLAEYCQ